MNAEQMHSVLTNLADLVDSRYGGQRANNLRGLAALFEGLGNAKVASIVNTIESNWKWSNREPRHPTDLREAVIGIIRVFDASNAKAQAKAFTILLKLLSGAGGQLVDAFVAEAVAARMKTSRSRGLARTGTSITTDVARRFADDLASAANDRTRFDTLLDQLERRCKVAELKTIAGLYTGYETTRTKKDEIIKAIRHWHREGELNRDRRASQAKTPL
jgi:hypothetical protein